MSAIDELLDFDSRQSVGCSRRNADARKELAALRAVAEAAREYDGLVWHSIQIWHKTNHTGEIVECVHPVCGLIYGYGLTLAAALEPQAWPRTAAETLESS